MTNLRKSLKFSRKTSAWFLLVGLLVFLNFQAAFRKGSTTLGHPSHQLLLELPSLSSSSSSSSLQIRAVTLPRTQTTTTASSHTPDYGGLEIQSLQTQQQTSSSFFERLIHPNDTQIYFQQRDKLLKRMSGSVLPSTYHSEELNYPRQCYRPSWVDDRYPVCNTFHELLSGQDMPSFLLQEGRTPAETSTTHQDDALFRMTYLNSGYFRNAWRMDPQQTNNRTTDADSDKRAFPFVLKTIRLERDMNKRTLDTVSLEALTMERLSASDRIADIYGHCALSVLVELGKEVAMDQKQQVAMSTHQKLDMAVAMAEGLAELHGFVGGVITSDDLKPEQWLHSAVDKNKIKLNDFNNGKFLEWNRDQQQYCPYKKKLWNVLLSPEQLKRQKMTEQSDVFSLGNVLYSLWTGGHRVFSEYEQKEREKMIKDGKTPELWPNDQDAVSRQMADIVRQCWTYQPDQRATVFSVVQQLREIQKSNNSSAGT